MTDGSRAGNGVPSARRAVGSADSPIVVVGAHVQSLFLEVDAVPHEGETVMGRRYQETVDGGKATNQAIAAAKLGAPVRFVSLIGDDDRAARVLGYLDRFGVDRRWVREADAPTDIGFVLLPPSGIPAIASCGDLALGLDRRFVASARDAFEGASIVVCQLEAPVECALAAFAAARDCGAMTILNPAPAARLPDELLRLTDVIVPNQHEAAAVARRDGPADEVGDALAAAVPWAYVVVTAGADGAYLCRAGSSVLHLPAPVVRAVDTTGAGDAFVGAMATRIRLGESIADAARFAVLAAALSVTMPGTIEAFATDADVAAAGRAGWRGETTPGQPDSESRRRAAP